jgi:imidazolonepropionase-like amidohydrolase
MASSRILLVLALLLTACSPRPGEPAVKPQVLASAPAGGFVVSGASVFDGVGFRAGSVHVVGDRVVGFVDAPPAGARVVDGRGHTLLPGLIDGHAHVGINVQHLERSIGFGVTTVVDLFGPSHLIRKLRAADLGPDGRRRAALFGAGNLATAPAGHGTEYGIPIPTIERPDDATAFVAARKSEGSDFLKIVLDTSPGEAGAPAMPTLSLETVRALVGAAHAAGLVAVVHTGGCEDLRNAAETGADVVAHGCALKEGDPLVAQLAARNVFFNPTLAVQLRPCGMEYWIPIVDDPEIAARLTDEERTRLGKDRKDHDRACSEPRMRLAGDAARAGIRLIAGPDAPNRRIPMGASLLAEIVLLRQAGATAEQALAAATSNPADAYRLRDRGRIAPGMRADLVLVQGDARADVRAVWHTRTVWKAGAAVERAPGPGS